MTMISLLRSINNICNKIGWFWTIYETRLGFYLHALAHNCKCLISIVCIWFYKWSRAWYIKNMIIQNIIMNLILNNQCLIFLRLEIIIYTAIAFLLMIYYIKTWYIVIHAWLWLLAMTLNIRFLLAFFRLFIR